MSPGRCLGRAGPPGDLRFHTGEVMYSMGDVTLTCQTGPVALNVKAKGNPSLGSSADSAERIAIIGVW